MFRYDCCPDWQIIFYSGGEIEIDSLEEDDTYVNFGEDKADEIIKVLDLGEEEIGKNGLSKEGAKQLKKAIGERTKVFK